MVSQLSELLKQSGVAGFYIRLKNRLHDHRVHLIALGVLALAAFAAFKPQQFADVWLTRDQQGAVLFLLEDYSAAANQFQQPKWQAFSRYRAEQFDQAALIYNQYSDTDSQLAYANALAHGRRYVDARDVYQQIVNSQPAFTPAVTNLALIQGIIDEVNRYSQSQKEEGASSKELGDEPQTGDGAEKQLLKQQLIEQYTAEQLLLDPALNEMWLRQVQKNPARFLANKFQAQHQGASQ